MFDFVDFWGNDNTQKPEQVKEEEIKTTKKTHRRKTECVCLSDRYITRRGFSESRILEAMKLEKLENGQSWHFISGGDADSLSFLKVVLLQCQKLDFLLFSTWCMGAEDILQFREWVENGTIEKLDCYVGEIFPNSYKVEWQMLNKMIEETQCGRVAVFKNHSKIYAGRCCDFYFVIESSANINTNPRTEQTIITINKDLFDFYKNYFDNIKSFEK